MGEFHNRPHLKALRQELRNNGTSAEAVLWTLLSDSKVEGRKFRRQHSFGLNIVVDFYCTSERLVIELDGREHYDAIGAANDEVREQFLSKRGIRVVRFENREVFQDAERVLVEDPFRVHEMIGASTTPPPALPAHPLLDPGSSPGLRSEGS